MREIFISKCISCGNCIERCQFGAITLGNDTEKCDFPFDPNENRPTKCLKCLGVCPGSLLMFVPMKAKREDGAPERYKISMVLKAYGKKYCPDCLKCVEICPSQAIKIHF